MKHTNMLEANDLLKSCRQFTQSWIMQTEMEFLKINPYNFAYDDYSFY